MTPLNPTKARHAIFPEPAGLFGLMIFWALFFIAGQKSLVCPDTFLHIKIGQVILETGQVLSHDIFSHTVPGKPWTAHEWLAGVFMALCYKLGGLAGVALAFFFIIGLTFTLLFKVSRDLSNEWAAFFAVAVAAFFAQTHLLARPHLFTWLFGATCLYLLVLNNRSLWLLPLLTALWSNLHGGVLIGLALQGVFLLGAFLDTCSAQPISTAQRPWVQLRRPCVVFLLSLFALGLNPFGYSLLLFPLQLRSELFTQNIAEWQTPNLHEMWYLLVWVILLTGLMVWHGRKTPWAWRLLFVLLIYQALGHFRHISIAALFLAPWTAMALHDCCGTFLRAGSTRKPSIALSSCSGPVLLFLSFVLLFTISTLNPAWWQGYSRKNFQIPAPYSQGAIDYLQKNGYPGARLLNVYSWGGFLLFALDPPPKVFIDGRADMYGEEVFADYGTLTNGHPGMDRLLDKYQIDWILYPRHSLLVRSLAHRPGWTTLYQDEEVSILALQSTRLPPTLH